MSVMDRKALEGLGGIVAGNQASGAGTTDGELRAIFDKFETSGDGTLDAAELKVAMRVAVGVDLAVAECEELVAVADTNGTGTVELFEFIAICRQQI